jgi:hypothetical protein
VPVELDLIAHSLSRRGDTNPKYTRPLGNMVDRCVRFKPDLSTGSSKLPTLVLDET